MREKIKQGRRWVIKVGSSLVTNNGLGLDTNAIEAWAGQLVAMQKTGIQLVLVSSGAVAEGVARLGLKTRPKQVHLQQAAAAVGQMGLVQAYESCFMRRGVHAAQILLSREDLSDRTGYLNARSTLTTLLDMGVVPVVNENDTVATAELCFGDNDTLAALVANLINADVMVVLTDQD
ncbi:MAG TPA: glutamate 5-kinase, partial [Porticoccaceae bacterium]|nr:glutamate 5-kinase [Porticoccaceae bacterium]